MMMRDERVDGGIFMASNVAGTTAVWNCRVLDPHGEVIGPHGDIERLRPLVGPPARTLDAGELIWMTDKTPHESLPLPKGAPLRQYFRLVVGEITAWFADHSTPNPLSSVKLPASVRVVNGNKFELYADPKLRVSCGWNCGSAEQLAVARGAAEIRSLAVWFGLGHLADRMLLYGISSVDRLLELERAQQRKELSRWDKWGAEFSEDGQRLFLHAASGYYDSPTFLKMVEAVQVHRRKVHRKAEAQRRNSGAKAKGPIDCVI